MLRLNVPRAAANLSPLDALLLRLSISELPQFWNVLRGEMSLVGPRPEGPERANHYSSWQQQRLTAKPGMTGLAQVYGMREQHSSEDKTRLDLQYMLRSSWLVDLSLLVETIWTLAVRLIQIPTRKLSPGPRNPAEGEALPAAYSSNQ
jgi:lipopolysaccharide/colanic/teichoic acid biosynthesis glycosyltransferase